MKILIAPDSFKESLSSLEIAEVMEKCVLKTLPEAKPILFPIADGGEGTLLVLYRILGGDLKEEKVMGPLGKEVKAKWLKKGKDAFIEMAQSSGLSLLKQEERNPLNTTTFGLGQLIKKAFESKCENFYIGIGGSATNDGGIGALSALGVKFYNRNNKLIYPGTGKDLLEIKKVDFADIKKFLLKNFIILSDVRNPLYGSEGASYVYAPQKGANSKDVFLLDKGLRNYANVVKRYTGKDISKLKGAGAAGGVGGGFYAFLNGKILSGIHTILSIGKFEEKIKKADLLLTGEGKIDSQIKYGKTLGVIFNLVKKYKIPTIAFAGIVERQVYNFIKSHLISIVSISSGITNIEESIKNAKELLEIKVQQVLKIYKFGSKM